MREQRIVLEHHRGAAHPRRLAYDVDAVYEDLTVGGVLVSRDHAQHRRLATAAGTQQAAIAAARNAQIDAIHGKRTVWIALYDPRQLHGTFVDHVGA